MARSGMARTDPSMRWARLWRGKCTPTTSVGGGRARTTLTISQPSTASIEQAKSRAILPEPKNPQRSTIVYGRISEVPVGDDGEGQRAGTAVLLLRGVHGSVADHAQRAVHSLREQREAGPRRGPAHRVSTQVVPV